MKRWRMRAGVVAVGLVAASVPVAAASSQAAERSGSQAQAAPAAAKVVWAGARSSRYGISPFPSTTGWGKALSTMSGYFSGSTPTAVWLVGEILFNGKSSGQGFNFPNPGGSWDKTIKFSSSDQNEQYLDYFDAHGIKVFLQFEPGFSPFNQLVDIVKKRYGDHPSVIGIGVDVEWYQAQNDCDCNKKLSDSTAKSWEQKVTSVDPDWKLFVKHYDSGDLPPSYRGGLIFIDDSEQNGSYSNFKSEMINFAKKFNPNPVVFQIGYPSDKGWWKNRPKPIPQSIGTALASAAPQAEVGVIWVDFSLRDVLPTS
jgi:hypothetical protein